MLALGLVVAMALGGWWLLRDRAGSPVGPTHSTDTAPAARPDATPLDVDDLVAADASAGHVERSPQAEPVVELSVRLVEAVARPPRTGELRPRVRGVPDLRVTWNGALEVRSDPDGVALFEGLAPRTGELQVVAQGGLLGWSGTLDLERPSGGLRRAGTRLTFEVELRVDHGRFGGRIVDPAGAPVAGAWIALVRGASGSRRSPADEDLLAAPVRSDDAGWFELPIVRDDERLELLVVGHGEGRPLGHVRMLNAQEASGARSLVVELPRTRRARVRVLTHDGRPALGRLCLQRDGALWPADCEPRLAHTPLAAQLRAAARAPGELDVELADGAWVVHFLPERAGASRTLFQFALGPESGSEFEFRLADKGPPAVPSRD